MNGLYPALDAMLDVFDVDPSIEPREAAPGPNPANAMTEFASKHPALGQHPHAPAQEQAPGQRLSPTMTDSQQNLTPAQRNFSDEEITQWMVDDPNMVGGVGQILGPSPLAGVGQPGLDVGDPVLTRPMGGDADNAPMEMDWAGWDNAVKDFQTDMQQATQMNGVASGDYIGPSFTDITDWWL
jgi:hypothetical protein